MDGIWDGIPAIRILIIDPAEHGRAHIQKKKKNPLDKKNERNMEWWILGLKPKDNMNWYERVWAHSRFIRVALRKRVDSLPLNFHGIHIYISPPNPPKKNAQRGLLSGS